MSYLVVTCARCGIAGTSETFIVEEGDEWECPPCWEREERRILDERWRKANTECVKPELLPIPNPEDDLFSDAMDRAVSMYHSVRHGAIRNAERAGEQMDGEKLARRALAAGIVAYLQELGFTSIKEVP